MHLVVKSTLARGEWALTRHRQLVHSITHRLSRRFGVRVLQMAVVSNHLHLHIKLGNRYTYAKFIRAWTAALAMGITKVSRTNKPQALRERGFWDRRPWTRILTTFTEIKSLMGYLARNVLEGLGDNRQMLDDIFARMTRAQRAMLVRSVFG